MSNNLFSGIIESPLGYLLIKGDVQGVTAIQFLDQASVLSPSDHPIWLETVSQLRGYFEGKRYRFTVPLHLEGTEFQKKVWQALQGIPCGQTVSYAEIARRIGVPNGARAVGNANGKNPIPIIIPCHRVVNANGTLGGFSAGLWRKKWLINHEKTFCG